jgi:hypothetical protein
MDECRTQGEQHDPWVSASPAWSSTVASWFSAGKCEIVRRKKTGADWVYAKPAIANHCSPCAIDGQNAPCHGSCRSKLTPGLDSVENVFENDRNIDGETRCPYLRKTTDSNCLKEQSPPIRPHFSLRE